MYINRTKIKKHRNNSNEYLCGRTRSQTVGFNLPA